MDREEILKILSTYDLTEDEKEYFYLQLYFTDQLNNKGDKQIQEFHEEQKENRDSILNEIAKIMLSYPIIDSSMSIGNTDKAKLKSELNTLIQSKIQSEVNSETLKTKDLLESIGKEKINTNNYIQSLGTEPVNSPTGNEKTLKTPKNSNSSNIPKKIKVGNDDSNESDNSIEDTLDEIINKKSDNKTWSDRLWKNKNDLQKDLKSEIDNFLNGQTTVNKIEENIKKKYNSDAYETKRLVHTETARVQEQMNQVWAKEHGIKDQMFMATLDYKTSMRCRGFDGKPFEFNDVNKPIPPLHPFCRSTLVNLPDKDWRPSKRLDNETKEEIDWQTYEEWKENYNVDTKDESDIIKKIGKNIKRKITDENPPLKLIELPEKHLGNISKIISEAPDYIQGLILNKSEDIKFLNIKTNERAHYDTKKKGIRINLDVDFVRRRGSYSALFHEMGHNLDDSLGRPSQNKVFRELINGEVNKFIKTTKSSYNLNDDNVYEFISNELELKVDYHSTADIFEGATNGKIVVGKPRSDGYWNKKYKLERETFAHFFEATVRNDKIKVDMFKNIFPESYAMFFKMLGKE